MTPVEVLKAARLLIATPDVNVYDDAILRAEA